ncbi:hypothetical protein GCM10027275_24030 [Rhabdobacter roseus]|uniref:DUF3667 domain-containing protein n=1 Tax=Rhabdobacter roseus TaxID=1655419 RepID=A0A840TSU4_9BACT|nr:DUF3667 domain-containing protein [Rhabdobacter roseus]MBB5284343.1 hypothetical protein [Rhabdobacter roseus]
MNPSSCKNCDAPLGQQSDFCSHCGQAAHVHRLDMPHIMHEVVHAVIHADKGIFHLMKLMALRPGIVVKEYVAGKRKKYFNPFNFLVLSVAVSTFVTGYFHLMDMAPEAPNKASALINKHINLIFFVAVPVSALFSWLLFRKSGYNYAENLTLHAFLGGFRIVFFLFLFTPLIVFYREYYYLMLGLYMAIWVAFSTWAFYQFYGGKLYVVTLKSLLTLFLTQVTITLFISLMLWIYFMFLT